jgi:hypothetical protein
MALFVKACQWILDLILRASGQFVMKTVVRVCRVRPPVGCFAYVSRNGCILNAVELGYNVINGTE